MNVRRESSKTRNLLLSSFHSPSSSRIHLNRRRRRIHCFTPFPNHEVSVINLHKKEQVYCSSRMNLTEDCECLSFIYDRCNYKKESMHEQEREFVLYGMKREDRSRDSRNSVPEIEYFLTLVVPFLFPHFCRRGGRNSCSLQVISKY